MSDENFVLKNITENVVKIKKPETKTKINPFPLSSLFSVDFKNYLMYWGVNEDQRPNTMLWIISPKPIAINESQVCEIDKNVLLDPSINENYAQ